MMQWIRQKQRRILRWVAYGVALSALSACANLPAWQDWSRWLQPPLATETVARSEVLFSHGEPQAPKPRAAAAVPEVQWVQALAPAAPEASKRPESLAVRAASLTVYFDNDQDQLNSLELGRLEQFAREQGDLSSLRWEVLGHTDSNHTPGYNLDLAHRRAQTVESHLARWGADASLIRMRWLGLTQPVADNSTELGRAQNRRAEIQIMPAESNR